MLDVYLEDVLESYPDLTPRKISVVSIRSAVEAYQSFIASQLSRSGRVDRSAAYTLLDEIVTKYSTR